VTELPRVTLLPAQTRTEQRLALRGIGARLRAGICELDADGSRATGDGEAKLVPPLQPALVSTSQ
jgi:hypothetical protein